MATHPTNIVALIFHAWYYLIGDSQQQAAIELNPNLGLETPKLQNYWLKNRFLLTPFIPSNNLQ